jgi:hypothetical protein
MKRVLIIIALACATSLLAPAQTTKEKAIGEGSSEQQIMLLESEGREATLKNDIEADVC